MSVIESGWHGYRFAKGVTARLIADEAPHETREAPHEARDPWHEAPQGSPGEPPLNERHKWIIAEYMAGRRPSRHPEGQPLLAGHGGKGHSVAQKPGHYGARTKLTSEPRAQTTWLRKKTASARITAA